VLSSPDQLYAPLLREDEDSQGRKEEQGNAQDQDDLETPPSLLANPRVSGSALDDSMTMETRQITSSVPDNPNEISSSNNNNTMLNWLSPSVRRVVQRGLQITTVADNLPFLLHTVAFNGKMSVLGLVAFYLMLVCLWFPFWLLAYLITEWGIYAILLGTIFFLGRLIIRILAFPGHSPRVALEVEKEFSKYSVRVLENSCTGVLDLCTAIDKLPNNGQSHADICSLWQRTRTYRNRVFGVYFEVLSIFYKSNNTHTVASVVPPDSQANALSTAFGNNPIKGDVGNLTRVTSQAQSNGRSFLGQLGKVLTGLSQLEQLASSLLNNDGRERMNEDIRKVVKALKDSVTELRDFLPALKIGGGQEEIYEGAEEDDMANLEAVRRRLEEDTGESAMQALKSASGSILPMLDPPLHESVFCLDVMRGTVLARYRGAQQFWIDRPGGGRIDALHFPAFGWDPSKGRNRRAVLYCNPNAGLIEVGTGMSMAGGNVSVEGDSPPDACWTDYYTQMGYDVYLFNYAGFGRSHGRTRSGGRSRTAGMLGSMYRIFEGMFLAFKPTPNSLRTDAISVCAHLINDLGIDELVIHGESIGGMAASGAARALTGAPNTRDKVALLICDRTFANLQAIAQRLVGA